MGPAAAGPIAGEYTMGGWAIWEVLQIQQNSVCHLGNVTHRKYSNQYIKLIHFLRNHRIHKKELRFRSPFESRVLAPIAALTPHIKKDEISAAIRDPRL